MEVKITITFSSLNGTHLGARTIHVDIAMIGGVSSAYKSAEINIHVDTKSKVAYQLKYLPVRALVEAVM